MIKTVPVPQNERGVIRVFALSMTPTEAARLKGNGQAIATALGTAAVIDAAHVEVFPIADLTGIGLAGYLIEGGAVPADQLAPDRAKLEALDGWAMVVFSLAFGDAATTLSPVPELTLIGTYGEQRPDYLGDGPMDAESAKPASNPAPAKKRSDAAMSGMVATLVLIVLAAFTVMLIWIAG